jgi:outer membrane protein assembly factor BamB
LPAPFFVLALVLSASPQQSVPPAQSASAQQPAVNPLHDELWAAARAGDLARVKAAIDKGAEVDAKARYNMTALGFAADKGHLDVVKFLIEKGADVNAQDAFYKARPIVWALSNKHFAVATLLLEKGSTGAAFAMSTGIQAGNEALVKLALAAPDLTSEQVISGITAAKEAKSAAMLALLEAKLATMPAPATVAVAPAVLQTYVGRYRNESNGVMVTVALDGTQLKGTLQNQPPVTLIPVSDTEFKVAEAQGVRVVFAGRGGMIERIIVTENNTPTAYERVTAETTAGGSAPAAGAPTAGTSAAGAGGAAPSPAAPAAAAAVSAEAMKPAPRAPAKPWPGFRGDNAAGNGDGQGAIVTWNVEQGTNVRWKTPIPGISNSSPIAWGNRIFVITAISSSGDKTFKTGLYGDVAPVEDVSNHEWKIYGLDRATGKILWERTASSGTPKVKRHTKASQANSTPVTDGKRVVAVFGSIGLLAAWDVDGKPLWTADLGVLDSGWFLDPAYQWGHSSSPIIYKDTVIVQADQQKGSFIAAYDLKTGKQVWRTDRSDEISTWGTPTLFRAEGKEQIVTNGTKIRGYDPATGKVLWTLGPNSEVTVGTPVTGDGLIYVTGGYPPVRPIYAIKPSANGTITLTKENMTTPSETLAWSNDREGTYIPTPIFYDGILYTCGNNGILTAYDGKTGERLYRSRVGGGGAFSASPVAADGKLYLANEDGEVYVVKAGRTFQEITKNEMKEVIMSTPAISDGVLIVRTLGHVYGLGEKGQ